MKIISADERLAEKRGVKVLIVGPTGVGKTSLLRTLDPRPHAVRRHRGRRSRRAGPAGRHLRMTLADRARSCMPHRRTESSFPPTACYSEAHYEASAAGSIISIATRLSSSTVSPRSADFRFATPNSSRRPSLGARRQGRARRLWASRARDAVWLHQLQHARGKNVVFVGILERIIDEFNRPELRCRWKARRPARAPRHRRPGHHHQWIDFGDGKPVRAFICTAPNPWNYPAKDRSGRLDQIEEPHLGKLIAKLIRSNASVRCRIARYRQSSQTIRR